jgi:hypothetical protein
VFSRHAATAIHHDFALAIANGAAAGGNGQRDEREGWHGT